MTTATTPQKKLLNLTEAAGFLGLSPASMYRLLTKRQVNKMPAKKKGGQWRFDPDALLAWDSKSE